MELQELRNLLLSRVQKLDPWGATEMVDEIMSRVPHVDIKEYAAGSDARLHILLAETRRHLLEMQREAHSPGREFPASLSQGEAFSKKKSLCLSAPGCTIYRNSVEEQVLKNESDPAIVTEKSSVSITPEKVSAKAHIPPSHSLRALEGEDVTGLPRMSGGPGRPPADEQSASTPDDNVPQSSNAIQYTASSSQLMTKPCSSFIRHAVCDACPFSHGFGPLGLLEMDIRQFLWSKLSGVPIADLPAYYLEKYRRSVQGKEWSWDSLYSLLERLHTTRVHTNSLGYRRINLLDYAHAPRDTEHGISAGSDSRKIFITFRPAKSNFTKEHVYDYFRQYGPVSNVTIPDRPARTFGFVNFQYPDSVRLLLSEWHPQVPHFIFFGDDPLYCHEARVFVKPYKERAKLKNSGEEKALQVTHSPPSHSLRALKGEDVAGSPSVSNGLDGPIADEHRDILALLPDEKECFYTPT